MTAREALAEPGALATVETAVRMALPYSNDSDRADCEQQIILDLLASNGKVYGSPISWLRREARMRAIRWRGAEGRRRATAGCPG